MGLEVRVEGLMVVVFAGRVQTQYRITQGDRRHSTVSLGLAPSFEAARIQVRCSTRKPFPNELPGAPTRQNLYLFLSTSQWYWFNINTFNWTPKP